MRLYKRNKRWHFDLRFRGRRYQRATYTTNLKRANEIARQFISELETGTYRPNAENITIERLADLVRAYYRNQGRRSGDTLEFVLKRLMRTFAGTRAIDITTERIERYKAERLETAAKSTINAELSALSLMFKLAVEQELLTRRPVIHFLDDSDNTRQGFVSQGDYLAIREHLPDRLADLTDLLWWTGLRLGTARQIQWRDVHGRFRSTSPRNHDVAENVLSRGGGAGERDGHTVRRDGSASEEPTRGGDDASDIATLRIRSETVKTKQAHEIPCTVKIAAVIARASQYRTYLEPRRKHDGRGTKEGIRERQTRDTDGDDRSRRMGRGDNNVRVPGLALSPWVFHHRSGKPLLNNWCEVNWKKAARRVGLEHIVIHDLRRSFVRNMRMVPLPEATIMAFTGHKTRDVFLRYNIVDTAEKTQALEKLEQYLGGQSKEPSVRRIKR